MRLGAGGGVEGDRGWQTETEIQVVVVRVWGQSTPGATEQGYIFQGKSKDGNRIKIQKPRNNIKQFTQKYGGKCQKNQVQELEKANLS